MADALDCLTNTIGVELLLCGRIFHCSGHSVRLSGHVFTSHFKHKALMWETLGGYRMRNTMIAGPISSESTDVPDSYPPLIMEVARESSTTDRSACARPLDYRARFKSR
jgi:hypothetical protein